MNKIFLNEKLIFLFLIVRKAKPNSLFFSKNFFDSFPSIDLKRYNKTISKLIQNGVIQYAGMDDFYIVTEFGSLLSNLDFQTIRKFGSKDEITYLNRLVKMGAFSHMERKK